MGWYWLAMLLGGTMMRKVTFVIEEERYSVNNCDLNQYLLFRMKKPQLEDIKLGFFNSVLAYLSGGSRRLS
ncbi:hypothetical protein OH492_08940 [Vibrio chagasii]|nr:hypothetical protein [Vibrio chagasii]